MRAHSLTERTDCSGMLCLLVVRDFQHRARSMSCHRPSDRSATSEVGGAAAGRADSATLYRGTARHDPAALVRSG